MTPVYMVQCYLVIYFSINCRRSRSFCLSAPGLSSCAFHKELFVLSRWYDGLHGGVIWWRLFQLIIAGIWWCRCKRKKRNSAVFLGNDNFLFKSSRKKICRFPKKTVDFFSSRSHLHHRTGVVGHQKYVVLQNFYTWPPLTSGGGHTRSCWPSAVQQIS